MRFFSIFLIVAFFWSCSEQTDYIEIKLEPGDYTQSLLRWSPKGEKLTLEDSGDGLVTNLFLGPESLNPIMLKLKKSEGADHFDLLYIDRNRNGIIAELEDTVLKTTPNESRGKMWSSFSTSLPINYEVGKQQVTIDYPLSFWFVEDPAKPDANPVIRYSRRGWMEGQAVTPYGKISILISEMEMNGRYDRNDYWAINYDTAYSQLFTSKASRAMTDHNWLGEQAFGVDSIFESGKIIRIKPVNPQITRTQEERQNDWLAVDREAKHSGDTVKFLHDYAYATELARKKGQYVLVDFETTWCGPCKTMDQFVYTADRVVEATKKMVCVKVDGDKRRDLVDQFKVSGYPTLILLNPELKEIKKTTGYQSIDNTIDFLQKN